MIEIGKSFLMSCVLICFLPKAESPCEQQTRILVKESIEEEGSLRKKFGVTKKKFPFTLSTSNSIHPAKIFTVLLQSLGQR